MNEEPFGPVALISSFKDFDEVMKEANRLPYAASPPMPSRQPKTMTQVGAGIESGMVSINHHGLALPEVPFGGMKDSGYGSEGGIEALEAYLNTKFM
jgi:succinate-semialdehyde dehydrogenase/glutarate-semialdehyde dehydrogenase